MAAICDVCKKEMVLGGSCKNGTILVNNKRLKRVPNTGEYCHDCNAGPGKIHHWGCDMERCPHCGGQLISCSCPNLKLEVKN